MPERPPLSEMMMAIENDATDQTEGRLDVLKRTSRTPAGWCATGHTSHMDQGAGADGLTGSEGLPNAIATIALDE